MTAEFDIVRGSILLKPETEIEAAFLRWHQGLPWFANHTSQVDLRYLVIAPDRRERAEQVLRLNRHGQNDEEF